MQKDQTDYSEGLKKSGSLLEGHFALTPKADGVWRHSDRYINKDAIGRLYPDVLAFYGGLAQPFLGTGVATIVGPAEGGIAFAHGVARHISRVEKRPVNAAFVQPRYEGTDTDPIILKRGFDEDIAGHRVLIIEGFRRERRTTETVLRANPGNIVGIVDIFDIANGCFTGLDWAITSEYPKAIGVFQQAQRFLEREVEIVVSPPGAGIPIAHGFADYLSIVGNRPVKAVYTEFDRQIARDVPMDLGPFRSKIEGQKVGLIEDITTTGGSAKRMIVAIQEIAEIIGLSVIADRGGVTSDDLCGVSLSALVKIAMESWVDSECPLCTESKPVSGKYGKGRSWVSTIQGQQWLAAGGSITNS